MKSLAEIEFDFRKQIKVPEHKPVKRFLFCPVGLVGSGKTTVTKLVADKFNLVRISSDELRKLLKEGGHDYSSLKEIVSKVVKDFADQGYALAFDMNCLNPKTKTLIEELSNDLNAPIIWVHINPPEEFIINKLKNFKHTWLFRDSAQAIGNYFHQKEVMGQDVSKINYLYTIDPSRSDLDKQIEVLSRLIEEKIS